MGKYNSYTNYINKHERKQILHGVLLAHTLFYVLRQNEACRCASVNRGSGSKTFLFQASMKFLWVIFKSDCIGQ